MMQRKTWLIGAAAACLAALVLPSQAALIAYYTFDEASGAVAHDSVGSIDGILSGSAAFAPGAGILGGAISLNILTHDLVDMGNNFGMTGGSFSIQAWVKLAPGDTTAYIPVSKHYSTVLAGYALGISDIGDGCNVPVGKASFYTAYPCSGASSISVNDGAWHQLVGVYDATTTRSSIYVDGLLQSTSAPGNTIDPAPADFMVGGISVGGTPTGTFTGLVDEIKIFDNALNADDVQTLNTDTLAGRSQTLSVSVTLSGSVISNTGSINCQGASGTCVASYSAGQQVVLTATPNPGYALSSWTGCTVSAGPTCTVTMNSAVSVTASFVEGTGLPLATAGFNLSGNGSTTPLNLVSLFGSADNPMAGVSINVEAVWSWNSATRRWRFHTPQLAQAASAAYARANGYEVLTLVPPGEGFWVNVYQPINVVAPTGTGFNYDIVNFPSLPGSFNLLAIGSTLSVQQFANNVGSPPSPPASFNALWAWDAQYTKWYFYSPSLEQPGAPFTNLQYCTANGFQDFGGGAAPAATLSLHSGLGFWVEKF